MWWQPCRLRDARQCRRHDAATEAPIRHLYVHIPSVRVSARTARSTKIARSFADVAICEAHCAISTSAQKFCDIAEPSTSVAALRQRLRQRNWNSSGGFRNSSISHSSGVDDRGDPGSVSTRKAALLRKLGVTRISSCQSWDDRLLKLLGREHSAKQAEHRFVFWHAAGFSNINVDLYVRLPGQHRAMEVDAPTNQRSPALSYLCVLALTWITQFFSRSRTRRLSRTPTQTPIFRDGHVDARRRRL